MNVSSLLSFYSKKSITLIFEISTGLWVLEDHFTFQKTNEFKLIFCLHLLNSLFQTELFTFLIESSYSIPYNTKVAETFQNPPNFVIIWREEFES